MKRIKLSATLWASCRPIEGGGYWGEVFEMPGCIAQAETIPDLKRNLEQAVIDWQRGSPEKTEEEARKLAELQGRNFPVGGPYPEAYPYLPPPDWSEEDE